MTETSNLTPEQKEKNKQYVLEHLDEYTLDSHGNFVLFSPDIDPEDEEIHFYFGKDSFTPEGHKEIKINFLKRFY